jgi:two-component system, LuxR family, response regulator FixJ
MPELAVQTRTSRPLLVLVEDDRAVLGALTFAFETEGYQVAAFGDAATALAASETRRASCLVLDQRLPGMSGLEVVAHLRAEGVTAPALLITTNPTPQLHRDAATAKIEIVEKPLLGDVLAAKVRALARMPGGGQEFASELAPANQD